MRQTVAFFSASCAMFAVSCTEHRDGAGVADSQESPTLNALSDGELFGNNSNVNANLQQEIKRQFLAAVSRSAILREFAGDSGALVLKEIGIGKTETSQLDIDFLADGNVQTRKAPAAAGSEAPAPLGGNVSTKYHLLNSTYNVSFAFQDRATSEIYRFGLSKPLVVEENLSISSRVKISFNAIKALPPQVGAIVARFLDDISLTLDSGMTWSRSSELSTRMYYRGNEQGVTELMRDFVTDVVQPVCLKYASAHGKPASLCDVKLSPVENPLAELGKARLVRGCEKTSLLESAMPVYKFYVEVPRGALVYRPGEKAFLYAGQPGAWRRDGWTTVVGEAEKSRCPGLSSDAAYCVAVKYGAHWFDGTCSLVQGGSLILAVSPQDVPSLLE